MLVKVLRDNHDRPYAFVQYTNDEDANRALDQAHNASLNGRNIRCERARVNRTLYCSSFDRHVTTGEDVRRVLEVFGEIEEVVPSSATSARPAYFVKFAYRDDAIRTYANLSVSPSWRVEWTQNIDRCRVSIDTRSVFVSSLNQCTTQDEIEERFGRHGRIVSCRIIYKEYSPTKDDASAIAYITYDSDSSAAIAIERENHTVFLGTTIHVQYKEQRTYGRDDRSLSLAPPPISFRRRFSKNGLGGGNGGSGGGGGHRAGYITGNGRRAVSHPPIVYSSHVPAPVALPPISPTKTNENDGASSSASSSPTQSTNHVPVQRSRQVSAPLPGPSQSAGYDPTPFYPMGYCNPYVYYPPRDVYPYYGGYNGYY